MIHLWRFVSVAGHKIRLQIEKSPFPDTVPGLHHKKPAEVRLDKKDVKGGVENVQYATNHGWLRTVRFQRPLDVIMRLRE